MTDVRYFLPDAERARSSLTFVQIEPDGALRAFPDLRSEGWKRSSLVHGRSLAARGMAVRPISSPNS